MTTLTRAEDLLRVLLGPGATFRDGQSQAIDALVTARERVLVVQRTGWGKSLVYFLAARLLREQGHGPTLLVSPLLSLMRNQIDAAARIGVRAVRMDSENAAEWNEVETALEEDRIDVLLVSPERLGNQRFHDRTLPRIRGGIGMLVVDEAHCISDWGHDFRPDYRRISRVVQALPRGTPMLATTATANDRVVADIERQLGPDLRVQRGSLSRHSLKLQTIPLADQAERLAWLAQHLHELPGSGVIYCLTTADCERVSAWLALRGIDAPAYHAQLPRTVNRAALESRLLDNEVKALVATVALGMGFDKPDLGFVVHFQRPGSLVAYYQQIGRAGRAVAEADAILLNGREDDEIQEFFIESAFPEPERLKEVLETIAGADGLKRDELHRHVNLKAGRIEQCLKLLEIDGAIYRDGQRYYRSANEWAFDDERARRVSNLRRQELEEIRAFVYSDECLMQRVTRALDDCTASPCGRCAVCRGALVSTDISEDVVRQAVLFLRRAYRPISPRKRWPLPPIPGRATSIDKELQIEPGRAVCMWGDAGWGRLVAEGKYEDGRFSEDLVDACRTLVQDHWRPQPVPTWVTAVPSRRRPTLVSDFAERLAKALGLPFKDALEKVRDTPAQKTMENSAQQAANVLGAFEARPDCVEHGPVLLVDDMVDSGWTFAECGAVLRQAGSGPVHPLALASASTGGGQ